MHNSQSYFLCNFPSLFMTTCLNFLYLFVFCIVVLESVSSCSNCSICFSSSNVKKNTITTCFTDLFCNIEILLNYNYCFFRHDLLPLTNVISNFQYEFNNQIITFIVPFYTSIDKFLQIDKFFQLLLSVCLALFKTYRVVLNILIASRNKYKPNLNIRTHCIPDDIKNG